MNLHHLEWLIGEPVSDPEMVVYEVRPYTPAQADRIVEHLCVLARFHVAQADDDPMRAERVRQAFGLIVGAARARQALLDLSAIETRLGKPPWRDLLQELRHDRSRFDDAIRDKAARIALRGRSATSARRGAPAVVGCIICANTRRCCAGRSTGR